MDDLQRAGTTDFSDYPRRRLLGIFAWSLASFVLFLIFVGAMVKSTNSGLSVPDWPNTYGHFMFSFPLDQMVGGIFWEHSHRMIASIAGLLTFALTVLVYRFDPRSWLRVTALVASAAVLVQGLFGGLTVLNFLPAWISVSHGTLAQIYFCLILVVALAQSRSWIASAERVRESDYRWSLEASRTLSAWVVGAIFLQLLLGAIMRHVEAGLVIPDFPTMFGSWSLPLDDASLAMANRELAENGILDKLRLERVEFGHMLVHLAHRFWAVVVAILGTSLVYRLLSRRDLKGPVHRWSYAFLGLLLVQISLGILTIYTEKNPTMTSFHVLCGAGLLGTAVAIAVHLRRVLFDEKRGASESLLELNESADTVSSDASGADDIPHAGPTEVVETA